MPKGERGFQKGRAKTGGRIKGGSLRTSRKFIDQLQRYGLNVARELAKGVMAMQDPVARYQEVRRLLPFCVPEIKPIDMAELEDENNNPETPINPADLLNALENNGPREKTPTVEKALPEIPAVLPSESAEGNETDKDED